MGLDGFCRHGRGGRRTRGEFRKRLRLKSMRAYWSREMMSSARQAALTVLPRGRRRGLCTHIGDMKRDATVRALHPQSVAVVVPAAPQPAETESGSGIASPSVDVEPLTERRRGLRDRRWFTRSDRRRSFNG